METLYSIHQIRALEQLAIEVDQIPESMLMDRAGKAAFNILQNMWPKANRFVVFCGVGKNAGDGYVLARLLKESEKEVKVYFVGDVDKLKGSAKAAYEASLDLGVSVQPFVEKDHSDVDVFIDALFGIGLKGALEGEFAKVVDYINQASSHHEVEVMAIDAPSGLLADTGCAEGPVVKADCTTTFIGLKQGFFTVDGPECCGEIFCNDLGVSKECFLNVKPEVEKISFELLRKKNLPDRSKNANKGDFGHVLIVGGTPGMSGSVMMSGEAALRVGAGLVTIATHPSHSELMTMKRPELMCVGVEDSSQLISLFSKATVIVIGMGLGQDDWGRDLLFAAIKANKPMVVDADALNILSEGSEHYSNWVLTPHPGEAGRLLKTNVKAVQADRFSAIKTLQSERKGICVLKGLGTLIKAESKEIMLCPFGNPGMSSGGMGDVLSGVIGGLVAQGLPLFEAAQLGVCVHAKAGDSAAQIQGERGLLATDLMRYLSYWVNHS